MEKSIIIAGIGGQGILFSGIAFANAVMLDGKNVTWYPSYGAEMRGGNVFCEIVWGEDEISSVSKEKCDYLIALHEIAYHRFIDKVKDGGAVILNTTTPETIEKHSDINYIFAPASDIANNIANIKLTNMAALGILAKNCNDINIENLKNGIKRASKALEQSEINNKVMLAGYEYKIEEK